MRSLFPTTSDILIEVLCFFNRPQLEQCALVNQQFSSIINTHLNKQPYRILYRVDIHTTKVGLVLSYDSTEYVPYLHYEKKGPPAEILPYLAAKCMKAQNLTLWISPIEFSRSREETIPELIDMVEQLDHIWKNSGGVAINSCLYVQEQVEMLEDLLFGLHFSNNSLMLGKKKAEISMGLEFSGSYSLLLFRNADIFCVLIHWDQIELSGLENCDEMVNLANYLAWIPPEDFVIKAQYIQAVCCFLDFLNEEDKHNNKQLFEQFMETVEKNFLSSTHARPYALHIDCFFGHEKAFSRVVQSFQSKILNNVTTKECLQIKCDNDSIKIERSCANN